MSRSMPNRMTVVAVALVVTAVGFVAATIHSTIGNGSIFNGGGPDNPSDTDWGDGFESDDPIGPGDPGGGPDLPLGDLLTTCIEFLSGPIGFFAILAAVVVVLFGAYKRHNAAYAGLFGTFFLPFVMLGYFLATNCPGGSGPAMWIPVPDLLGSVGSGSIDPTPPNDDGSIFSWLPPELLGVFVGGVLMLAVAMIVRMTRSDDRPDLIDADPEAHSGLEGLASAAGRAADRIEQSNVPVDNAVYQAWLEMTRIAEMERPDTATPEEFADRAIELGIEPSAVYRLRDLFTEVRFGGKSAETREDEAITVLRRIETSVDQAIDAEEASR